MGDVETVILDELERLSPSETPSDADWADVLRRTSLRSAPRPSRMGRRTVALVAAAIALVVTGAAVAGLVLTKSEAEEAQSLLDGHSVFTGTDPVCTTIAEGHFRCVLARPPTGEGTIVLGSYRGAKFETVDADDRIDGGCVGVSDDGTVWTCYLGELAVEHDILDPGVLGQEQTAPGHG
jgi:hypothetical protein